MNASTDPRESLPGRVPGLVSGLLACGACVAALCGEAIAGAAESPAVPAQPAASAVRISPYAQAAMQHAASASEPYRTGYVMAGPGHPHRAGVAAHKP